MREPFQPMPYFEWKRSTVILVWVAFLLSVGCAPKDVYVDAIAVTSRLRRGMTEAEVRNVIGKRPTARMSVGPMAGWIYTDEVSGDQFELNFENDQLHDAKFLIEDADGNYSRRRIPLSDSKRGASP